MLWLLAARKKKLLQSLQLLLKHLLQPPTPPSSLQLLPTQPSLPQLLTLLLLLRWLLRPLPTLLLPLRPLLRKLLTLQPSNQIYLVMKKPAFGPVFLRLVVLDDRKKTGAWPVIYK